MLYNLALYAIFCYLFFGLGFDNEAAKDTLGAYAIAFLYVVTNFLDGHSTIMGLKNPEMEESVVVAKKAINRFGLIGGVIIVKLFCIPIAIFIFIGGDTVLIPSLALSCVTLCISLNNYRLYFQYCRNSQTQE